MNRSVYLDRDGVLIQHRVVDGKPCAPSNIADIIIQEEVLEACKRLKTAGYLLVMVTNQAAIANGVIDKAQAESINSYLELTLKLDAVEMCSHGQNDNCVCRKPKPYMLEKAAKSLDIDLINSFMIGDRWSDIEAGEKAGCKTIYIKNSNYEDNVLFVPDFIANNLKDAADWILKQETTDEINGIGWTI
jgi:D-glycero-D-manno-heptose 1,7-bisphosphate phosphatase